MQRRILQFRIMTDLKVMQVHNGTTGARAPTPTETEVCTADEQSGVGANR